MEWENVSVTLINKKYCLNLLDVNFQLIAEILRQKLRKMIR
jgi:hypothetical protein